ncbi:adenosine 3'-phospho 5'-phosphosulfate transporter 1 isoform X2 [Danaus plexippus]|uniref:adenosine 3'-phospho 5'-phosphosulfate transporter 1 isoform X2 n=1 Tax=Danaus plexippus TaxID=13037 RepID=UPI002AB1D63A|nr:adenosine 3'-phospho 5'-phosphosulfate transporter 1 isoform X2 [Danaus plexippus]
MRSKFVIGTVLGLFVLFGWLLGHIYGVLLAVYEETTIFKDLEYSWVFRLLLNLVGYSTVILPCFALYKYLEKTHYFEKITNNNWVSRLLRTMFLEQERLPEVVRVDESLPHESVELALCVVGLMGAYLVWGLLQEKIMTTVLSKSCKVIPVMLMGKLISRAKYESYEYVTAVLISLGMALFLFGTGEDHAWGAPSVSGACLLVLYLCCDSFTSSWQGALFRRHGLQPLQMLLCVSLCSCSLSAAALLGRPLPALISQPSFVADACLLALSSAAGQLIIYRTIARFGPVVFAICMTLRQAGSVLLSCLVFGHRVSAGGAAGVTLVFSSVFLRLYWRRRRAPLAAPGDK